MSITGRTWAVLVPPQPTSVKDKTKAKPKNWPSVVLRNGWINLLFMNEDYPGVRSRVGGWVRYVASAA